MLTGHGHHDAASWFGLGASIAGVVAGLVAASIEVMHGHHDASWFGFIVGATAIAGLASILVFSGLRRGKRGSSSNGRREAPWLAEFLLYIFARAKDIEALMGDFEEYFERDCASGMSERRADVRYWARVLRSLWPQIWQWIKRVGWAGLIAAVLKR